MKHITIVGGGFVGSLLAVLLAKRGHTVDVYERRSRSAQDRASTRAAPSTWW
jgi:2-polyprenyl-6-methoxyphenol hydroxylase-like FAD-dependent oxidoreductase